MSHSIIHCNVHTVFLILGGNGAQKQAVVNSLRKSTNNQKSNLEKRRVIKFVDTDNLINLENAINKFPAPEIVAYAAYDSKETDAVKWKCEMYNYRMSVVFIRGRDEELRRKLNKDSASGEFNGFTSIGGADTRNLTLFISDLDRYNKYWLGTRKPSYLMAGDIYDFELFKQEVEIRKSIEDSRIIVPFHLFARNDGYDKELMNYVCVNLDNMFFLTTPYFLWAQYMKNNKFIHPHLSTMHKMSKAHYISDCYYISWSHHSVKYAGRIDIEASSEQVGRDIVEYEQYKLPVKIAYSQLSESEELF